MEDQINDGKKTINSAFFYSLANIISVIVSFIAIPILTNILSTNDMGIAVSFVTLRTILSYILLLAMYTTIDRAILEYKKSTKEYICSIYIFSDFVLIILYFVYLVFRNKLNLIFGFNTKMISLMFLIIIAQNGYTLMTTYWNFKNEYKKNFIVNLLSSPISQILSIIFACLLTTDKYMGRIIGIELFASLIGIFFGIKILIDGHFNFSKKFIKYALCICLPIIPHLISQTILSQSDLLMIRHYIGNSEAGIYSLAYSIALVLFTILLQIMRPWSSWVYRRLDSKQYESVRSNSKGLFTLGWMFTIGLLMINKEIIYVFLNSNYYDTVYIVPSLIIGVYFQFLYMFYYDIQYYYKKSKSIMYGSILVAFLNIILNMIFIPKLGYKVAGYTTLISYGALSLFHYVSTKRIIDVKIYENKKFFILSLIAFFYMIVTIKFSNNLLIRYFIGIILLLVVLIKNIDNYLKIIKIIFNKEENFYVSRGSKTILSLSKKFPKICKLFSLLFEFLLLVIDTIWKLFNKSKVHKNKKQVLIIFMYNLGDIIVFLDLAAKLRNFFPKEKYDLNLVCQSSFVELMNNQELFDNVYGITLSKHIKNFKYRFCNYKKLNCLYEYIISPLGFTSDLGSDVLLNKVLNAKNKITVYEGSSDDYNSINKFYLRNYSKIIFIDSEKYKMQLEINNIIFNNITNLDNRMDLPVLKEYKYVYDKDYYIVFPSSSSSDRVWDVNKFSELAKKIYKLTNLPIMICGTSNDKLINNKFISLLGNDIPYIDMTCKTSILEFIELIRKSKFVVTNDTGTYHVAIGTKTNVLVIAPEAHFSRFIKYGKLLAKDFFCDFVIGKRKCLDCNYNCKYRKINDNIWPCLNDINLDDVWEKTILLIESSENE